MCDIISRPQVATFVAVVIGHRLSRMSVLCGATLSHPIRLSAVVRHTKPTDFGSSEVVVVVAVVGRIFAGAEGSKANPLSAKLNLCQHSV